MNRSNHGTNMRYISYIYIYIYKMEYLGKQKNTVLMKLGNITLSKISQTQRVIHCMIPLTGKLQDNQSIGK